MCQSATSNTTPLIIFPPKSVSKNLSRSHSESDPTGLNRRVIHNTTAYTTYPIRRTVSNSHLAASTHLITTEKTADFQLSIEFIDRTLSIMPEKTSGDLKKKCLFLENYLIKYTNVLLEKQLGLVIQHASDKWDDAALAEEERAEEELRKNAQNLQQIDRSSAEKTYHRATTDEFFQPRNSIDKQKLIETITANQRRLRKK